MKALRLAQQIATRLHAAPAVGVGICNMSSSAQAIRATANETRESGSKYDSWKYDPLDLEYDRFNGASAPQNNNMKPAVEPLGRPVDLEFEMDRDDPDATDIEALFSSSSLSDAETLFVQDINLDDEYDRIHELHDEAMFEPLVGGAEKPKGTVEENAKPAGGSYKNVI